MAINSFSLINEGPAMTGWVGAVGKCSSLPASLASRDIAKGEAGIEAGMDEMEAASTEAIEGAAIESAVTEATEAATEAAGVEEAEIDDRFAIFSACAFTNIAMNSFSFMMKGAVEIVWDDAFDELFSLGAVPPILVITDMSMDFSSTMKLASTMELALETIEGS